NNLANRQSAVGRREEALATAEEAVAIRRRLADANPAAYLADLAMSVNNLANRQSAVGRREEALATAEEAVAIRRRLADANPAAYLANLATSVWVLHNQNAERGERAFAEVLERLDGPWPVGTVLRRRADAREDAGHPVDACRDAIEAARLLDEAGDTVAMAGARNIARRVREHATPPLPLWLWAEPPTEAVVQQVVAWVQTPTWDESEALAPDLLHDDAEAAVELLIEANPGNDGRLRLHRVLLHQCRRDGVEQAYRALRAQLAAQTTVQALNEWIAAPDWDSSAAYLAEHADVLLTDLAAGFVRKQGDPIHRALHHVARTDGVEAAYQLADTGARRQLLAEAAVGVDVELVELLAAMDEAFDAEDAIAPFYLGVAAALRGESDAAEARFTRAAEQVFPHERPSLVDVLERLAEAHPDHAATFTRWAERLAGST
ncbi:MAG: tetratricopeptide repeat protein, partial [Actinomycetota bacterium]|nr:tetratricopeptide repeat protein [Actinomycetota bacterium]